MSLTGKRILITRPRAQAEAFAKTLIAEGAQPFFFPVIQILPPDDFAGLDAALKKLNKYNWLIFTSVHSVDSFWKRLSMLGINHLPDHLQVAAIGAKTSKRLAEHHVVTGFIPDEYTTEAILNGFSEDIDGKLFLLPQSDISLKSLADGIQRAGGHVDEVIAYRNVINQPSDSEFKALRDGVDIVTFASPSAVRNFIKVVEESGLNPFDLPNAPLFACIGPVTKKAAEEAGFINIIEANQHTVDGLIDLMGNLVQQ